MHHGSACMTGRCWDTFALDDLYCMVDKSIYSSIRNVHTPIHNSM